MTTEVQHAYAAGFFDGEGCVRIKPQHKGRSFAVGLVALQVDPAPLGMLCDLYGGSLALRKAQENTNQRACWCWEKWGALGVGVALRAMFPYLIVKKAQAEVALGYVDVLRDRRGWPRLTDDEIALRRSFADRLSVLNQRGVPAMDVGL